MTMTTRMGREGNKQQKQISSNADRRTDSPYDQGHYHYNSRSLPQSQPQRKPPHKRRRQQQKQQRNGEGEQSENFNSTTLGDYDHNTPSFDEKLHTYLLNDYIKAVYPWEWWWNKQRQEEQGELNNENETNVTSTTTSFQRKGLPVEFGVNFFKVFKIDVTESTADLVAWARIRWIDPRLTWDPNFFGGLTETNMWIEHGSGGNEASQIWTPDIYLWNQEEPMANTLADTYAVVRYDGTVLWSRPGRIKAICKFGGLSRFPYDTLLCTFQFSTWSRSKEFIQLKKYDGIGYTIDKSETAGQSYNEFFMTNVDCRQSSLDRFNDWPVLYYDVGFDRAEEPYIRGYIVSQSLLTVSSLASMWIPPHIGERMGLAITSVLAGIALELVVTETLPKSEEFSWFAAFALGNTLIGIIIVIQTTVVIYFYYYTGKTLRPIYVRKFVAWYQQTNNHKQNDDKNSHNNDSKNIIDDSKSQQQHAKIDGNNATPTADALSHSNLSPIAEDSSRTIKCEDNIHSAVPKNIRTCNSGRLPRMSSMSSLPPIRENEDQGILENNNEEGESGSFSVETYHNWPAVTYPNVVATSDPTYPAHFDATKYLRDKAQYNNHYWQSLSSHIDEYSRLIIPVLYLIFLTAMFSKTGDFGIFEE